MTSFADRVCVVTGAGRGLGAAIAEDLAARGAAVAALDVDMSAARATAARCGGRSTAYRCDVSDRREVESVCAAVETDLGPVDVLVNNAGINPIGPSESFAVTDWDATVAVNLTGVFHLSQVLGRSMLRRGRGSIVNIASINARSSWPRRLAYCATKAAVVSMTEVLGSEWATAGVRVNAVSPGVIETDLVARAIAEGSARKDLYLRGTPMRRLGRPQDVASAVAFLADDELAGFVTGTVLTVDGGWMADGWVDEG